MPIWVSGSYDPRAESDLSTAPASPSRNGPARARKGDNLYSDCIVALDIDTGKLKWYFQNTPHDTA